MKKLIRRISQRLPGNRARSASGPSAQVVEEQRDNPVGDTYEMNIPRDHVTIGFVPSPEEAAESDDQGAISFTSNCVWCYSPFQVVAGDNGEQVHLLTCCQKKVGAVGLKASEADQCPFCASKIN